jgi:hypothetical protein
MLSLSVSFAVADFESDLSHQYSIQGFLNINPSLAIAETIRGRANLLIVCKKNFIKIFSLNL